MNANEKHVNWEKLSVLAETANNRRDDSKVPLLGLPATNLINNEKSNIRSPKKMKRRPRKSIPVKRTNLVDLNKSTLGPEPELEPPKPEPKERSNPSSNGDFELTNSREQKFPASTANGFTDKPLRRLFPVWFTLVPYQDKYVNLLTNYVSLYFSSVWA